VVALERWRTTFTKASARASTTLQKVQSKLLSTSDSVLYLLVAKTQKPAAMRAFVIMEINTASNLDFEQSLDFA
jgi:hypothetical protein